MSFEEIVDTMSREVFFEICKMVEEQHEHAKTYEEYKKSIERQYENWRRRQYV